MDTRFIGRIRLRAMLIAQIGTYKDRASTVRIVFVQKHGITTCSGSMYISLVLKKFIKPYSRHINFRLFSWVPARSSRVGEAGAPNRRCLKYPAAHIDLVFLVAQKSTLSMPLIDERKKTSSRPRIARSPLRSRVAQGDDLRC